MYLLGPWKGFIRNWPSMDIQIKSAILNRLSEEQKRIQSLDKHLRRSGAFSENN